MKSLALRHEPDGAKERRRVLRRGGEPDGQLTLDAEAFGSGEIWAHQGVGDSREVGGEDEGARGARAAVFEQARGGETGFGEHGQHVGLGGEMMSFMAQQERVGGGSGFEDETGRGGEMDHGDGMEMAGDGF